MRKIILSTPGYHKSQVFHQLMTRRALILALGIIIIQGAIITRLWRSAEATGARLQQAQGSINTYHAMIVKAKRGK